jgi:nicotinate-nucleotide adenylyltransferase
VGWDSIPPVFNFRKPGNKNLQQGEEIKKLGPDQTGMNIGFFGGSFDPIHRGHIALAQAAREKFQLGRIYFVPTSVSPFKQNLTHTSFVQRYAMVTLATAGEKSFIPSLLEAPEEMLTATSGAKGRDRGNPKPSYSINTVSTLKHQLKDNDRLFFLIGIDAFREIAKWHQAERLFEECDFIVASRPGYSLADVANALPEKLRPAAPVIKPFEKQAARGDLVLSGARVHLLDSTHHAISATAARTAIAAGKPTGKLLDPAVADYIRKTGLYKDSRQSSVVSRQQRPDDPNL